MAFAGYSRFLSRWKYTSQSLTAGALWFAGDLLSQRYSHYARTTTPARVTAGTSSASKDPIHPPFQVDWKRTASMTSFGLFIAGPLYTYWYRLLDDKMIRVFERHVRPAGTPRAEARYKWQMTMAKLGADILLFDPAYLVAFFTTTHLFTGSSVAQTWAALLVDFPPTFRVDVAVWTPVQFFNFRYVPVLYQPVVVNVVNIGWNSFLSHVKHHEHAPASMHTSGPLETRKS